MSDGIKDVFASKKIDGTINNEFLITAEKFYNCRHKCANQKEKKLAWSEKKRNRNWRSNPSDDRGSSTIH